MDYYMVTPSNGNCTAPSMLVSTNETKTPKEDAEKKAKLKSGLGRFDNWVFNARKIH